MFKHLSSRLAGAITQVKSCVCVFCLCACVRVSVCAWFPPGCVVCQDPPVPVRPWSRPNPTSQYISPLQPIYTNWRVSVIVTLPPPVCVTTVKKRTWRLVMAPNVCECLVVSTKWGREEEVNCEICEMSPRSSLSLRSMVRWLVTDEGWSRRIGARTEQTIFHSFLSFVEKYNRDLVGLMDMCLFNVLCKKTILHFIGLLKLKL